MIGAFFRKRSSSVYIPVLLIFFTTSTNHVTSLTVSFNESTYIVNKNDGLVQPVLVLNESSSTDITVQVRMADDITKFGGEDVELYNVTFTDGKTTASFNVTITTDIALENNKTFYLMIIKTSLHENITCGENGNAKIVIVNNEYLDEVSIVSINFNQSVYIVNEDDGLVQAVLVLNSSTITNITVQVRTNDNTATANDDYNSGPYNVMFSAGVTSVSLNITINTDEILEGNETFMLIITNSSLNDQGFVFTTGDYDKATVIIFDATKPVARPREKHWYVNTTATLSCKATANGNISYQWRRVSGEITSDKANGVNTSKLTISPVTEEDEGDTYYCVATYGTVNGTLHNVTSNKVIIIVYGPPMVEAILIDNSVKHQPVYYVTPGDSLKLDCRAIQDPQSPNQLTYSWLKDAAKIDVGDPRFSVSSSLLFLLTLKVHEHNGTYTCSVYEVYDSRAVSKVVTLSTAVIVEIPATIATHPQQVVVSTGESVTLSCEARGSDPIRYQWRRVNGEISSYSKGVSTTTLTISPVTEQDEDEYYCVASNGGPDGLKYEKMSNKAMVTVYGPPKIQPFDPYHYVTAGETFTINCTVTDVPQSSDGIRFFWYRDHHNITNLTKVITNSSTYTSQLYIEKLDSDQLSGQYMCVAYNDTTNASATTTTTVIIEIGNFRNLTVKILGTQSIDELSYSSTVNLPSLTIFNNTISHLFVIVTTDGDLIPDQVPDSDLVSYSISRAMYVAVVYNMNEHELVNKTVIGSKSNYQYNGITYYNAPLMKDNAYYSFVRAYLFNHTKSSPKFSTSGLSDQIIFSAPPTSTVSSTATAFIGSATSSTVVNTRAFISTTFELPISAISTTSTFSTSRILNSSIVPVDSTISDSINLTSSSSSEILSSSVPMFLSSPTVSMTSSSAANSSTTHSTTSDSSESAISTSSSTSTISIISSSTVSTSSSASTTSGSMLSYSSADPILPVPSILISLNSSTTSPIVSTASVTPTVSDNEDSSGNNSGAIGAIVGVVIVLIIIIVIVIIVIIVLMKYKKRYKQLDSSLASPVSTKFEMSLLQETDQEKKLSAAGSKSLPLIMIREEQIKTSVGQPTTLHIIVQGDPIPEINWSKDEEPINYPMQEDGSLYIYNTSSNDQGCYTVTATNSEGESSQAIQLVVLNPQFVPSIADKKPIKVEDFAEHLAMLQSNKNQQFCFDYESLVSGIEYTFHAAKLGANVPKNRYKNILPYDHSRVVLKLKDNCPGSDYINASFLDGYNEKKAYIACQGPMESTVPDFWRMVWEKCVNTIVMITNLNEEGKPKCHRYWPENKNDSITCDNVSITLLEETVLADYTVRKLTLKMTEDSDEAKGVSLEVEHFQYTVWPDHGVPKYATSMLLFHKCVFEHHKRRLGTPLLVHCSAGVGRTGTFVTIDIELQRIKQESVVDVYNTIYKLRYQRVSSVQTLAQYVFVFDALMESIMCGDNSINVPANVAKERLEKLAKVNPATKLSGYEVQFKKLEEASPKISDFTYDGACMNENWHKNRSMQHLPPDGSRVYITRDKLQSDYICASYVDGYHHRRAFMITEGPMEPTLVNFWTMIWEKKSHVIVMLSLLEENGEEVSAKYWPNQGDVMEVDKYIIQNNNERTWGKYFVRRTLKVYNSKVVKDSEPRIIHQFHYLCWPDHSCPREASSIMDLVEMVEKQQRQTNNGPITVHCSDGVGRTGTFCALMLCRQRLLTEHMADVFYAIKTLRAQRPGMVENSDQYVFIHKTLVETMDRLDRYSNLHA